MGVGGRGGEDIDEPQQMPHGLERDVSNMENKHSCKISHAREMTHQIPILLSPPFHCKYMALGLHYGLTVFRGQMPITQDFTAYGQENTNTG